MITSLEVDGVHWTIKNNTGGVTPLRAPLGLIRWRFNRTRYMLKVYTSVIFRLNNDIRACVSSTDAIKFYSHKLCFLGSRSERYSSVNSTGWASTLSHTLVPRTKPLTLSIRTDSLGWAPIDSCSSLWSDESFSTSLEKSVGGACSTLFFSLTLGWLWIQRI